MKAFVQRHVILFVILVAVMESLIVSINIDQNALSGLDMLLTHLLVSVIALYFMKKLSVPLWTLKVGFLKGILMGLPFIILGFSSVLSSNAGTDFSLLESNGSSVLLLFTINMIFVGIEEELIFRGLIFGFLLKNGENKKNGINQAILASALIFGIMHLSNIFIAPITTVFVQTLFTAAGGFLYCVIYYKCRNIWSVIIIHTCTDWISLVLDQCFTNTTSIISTTMSLQQILITLIVGVGVPLLLGIVFIKTKEKLA